VNFGQTNGIAVGSDPFGTERPILESTNGTDVRFEVIVLCSRWIDCFTATRNSEVRPLAQGAEKQKSPPDHRTEPSDLEVFTK
jgi:hypothetical protein